MRTARKEDDLALAAEVIQRLGEKPSKCENRANSMRIDAKTDAKTDIDLRGIPVAELQELAGDDWDEVLADPARLEALAHCRATTLSIQRGEIPASYTSQSNCAQCGPIPIFEGAPKRVHGCPWCFVGGYQQLSKVGKSR